MTEWSDLLLEETLNRRQFLKLGILPLLLSGLGGIVTSLILTPEDAEARSRKSPPAIKPRYKKAVTRYIKRERRPTRFSRSQRNTRKRNTTRSRNSETGRYSARRSRRYHVRHYHRKITRRSYTQNFYINEEPDNEYYLQFGNENERVLYLYNVHTGEFFNDVYWADGDYLSEQIDALNKLMRDHYTGEIVNIDTRLFDLLYSMCGRIEYNKPLHIISAYRCLSTNNMLREQDNAVALHSLHIDGMAVDIRAPGLHTSYLRKVAIDIQRGGVGYYPGSDFVHVDTGPIRYW